MSDRILVNSVYPLIYFTLDAVQQIKFPDNSWWASKERFASIASVSDESYVATTNSGRLTTEFLEIDLGREREVNYLNFDVLRAPLNISIEYDAVSSPDLEAHWVPVSRRGDLAFDSSTRFEATSRSAWFNAEFVFDNGQGQPITTRYLRIGFTRRDEPWPLAQSSPFKWSVFVKHLRVGMFIASPSDTMGSLFGQDLSATLDEYVLPDNTVAGDTSRDVRQAFVLPDEIVRANELPHLLGFGFLVNHAGTESVGSFSWQLYDVTDPAAPLQLTSGVDELRVMPGVSWLDVFFDQPWETGDLDKIYQVRVQALNPLSTVYLASPNTLTQRDIPGTYHYTNGSDNITTADAIPNTLLSPGDWFIRSDHPDTAFQVLSVDLNSITITAPYPDETITTGISQVYPLTIWNDETSTYSSVALSDHPIAYFRLGEPSGGIMVDSSTLAHDGTFSGSPTHGAAGLLYGDSDTATTFAISKYGTATHVASYDTADVITLEAWIQTTSGGSTNQGIISRGLAGAYMRINSTGKLEALKSQTATIVASTINVNDGLPHHVVWTKNGAVNKLYVDGVDVTGTVTNVTLAPSGSLGVYVGTDQGSTEYFGGVIDEAAMYATALSPSRVAAHYRAGLQQTPYSEIGNQNLVMRLWGDIGARGQDVLGNTYRYVIRNDEAANVFDGTKAGWMSDPLPSTDAVESLYFDVRDVDVDHNNIYRVIDAMKIAPRTPGVQMNIYYSKDNLKGETPRTRDEWDYLLWTPVSNNSFVLRRNDLIEYPSPIRAAFIKLEFTKLNPLPVNLPIYPPAPPKEYRRFPTWVEQQFTSSPLRNTIEDWWLRSATPVQIQTLVALADPVREFEYKEQEFFSALALGNVQDDLINSGLIDTAQKAVIDPVTGSKIYIQPLNPYKNSLLIGVDQNTILGAMVVNRYDNNTVRDPVERVDRYVPLDQSNPVSFVGDRVTESYAYLAQLPLRFNKTCRHAYQVVTAEYNKKAFFVGIDEVQFLRKKKEVKHDDIQIQDLLYDDDFLEENTWRHDLSTAIEDPQTVYISYRIGDTDYTDEVVVLQDHLPQQLAGIGGTIYNIHVYSMPNQKGLQYYANDDYQTHMGTNDDGVRTWSISRSDLSERLTVPEQPIIYVDAAIVRGIGFIPRPPTDDTGTVVSVGAPSGVETLNVVTPDMSMGLIGTGTMADARQTLVDSGTVTGVGHPSSTEVFEDH